jgi:cell division protein FtsX
MIISIVAVIAAIVGTWWIHINFSASVTSLTPLFLYERNWAITQIGFTAFCVAIWMGILGYVPALDIREE